jgi:hypothetical protein
VQSLISVKQPNRELQDYLVLAIFPTYKRMFIVGPYEKNGGHRDP